VPVQNQISNVAMLTSTSTEVPVFFDKLFCRAVAEHSGLWSALPLSLLSLFWSFIAFIQQSVAVRERFCPGQLPKWLS
jgi:hypothetical protein